MELFTPFQPESTSSLGMALVMSSNTPLVLLSESLRIQAASGSFCRSFSLDPDTVVGKELFDLGHGEWDIPQLRSLLRATANGNAAIEAYEMALPRQDESARCLVLNAHVLDQEANEAPRLVLAVLDITDARAAAKEMDTLVQEKEVLLQELNHRVANSLQIIASVLMQRVRNAQSEETRGHLRDAHHRVMSVATLQRQLAKSASGDVSLRPYLTDLCASIGASMISDPDVVSLTVEADGSVMPADKSVSVGLIVTELAINSLKHAYPDPERKGAITVGFKTTGDGWALTVADDGIGIPGDHASGKPGLGTGIVNALAAQLKATVEVADADPGCVVSIIHR